MKKLLTSVFLFVAIVSFGGNLFSAHAETLTPAQIGVLQQSLDALKAKLFELRQQAASQAASQASTPAASGVTLTLQSAPASPVSAMTGPSMDETVAIKSALSSLATALSGLQSTVANNPQLVTTNAHGISMALSGIGNSLAMMGTMLGAGHMSSGVVAITLATQSVLSAPVVAVAPSPSAQVAAQPLLSANGNGSPESFSPAADNVQTAQAVSAWSWKNLNWPLVAVGFLILAAIALWLFWPDEEESKVVVRDQQPQQRRPA